MLLAAAAVTAAAVGARGLNHLVTRAFHGWPHETPTSKLLDRAVVRTPPQIVLVLHIGCVGRWREIASEQIAQVKASGLAALLSCVHVGANGPGCKNLVPNESETWGLTVPIHFFTMEEALPHYENDTINDLQKLAKQLDPNDYVLYLHTKGVTAKAPMQHNWRKYMMHHVVDHHELCIQLLNRGLNTVGANVRDPLNHKAHYSGNFWWATAGHLQSLEHIQDLRDRFKAEFWVLSKRTPNAHAALGRSWIIITYDPWVCDSVFQNWRDLKTLVVF